MAVQSQDTQPLKRARLLYIDNLRVVLTALVVLHHLAIQYDVLGQVLRIIRYPKNSNA